MLFNSFIFIFVFLPGTLFLFFITAKYSRHGALLVLFLASIIFYGWCDYHYALLLLCSITTNFIVGKLIFKSTRQEIKKYYLWVGIIFNLGTLGYFKYTDFFIQNINQLFNSHINLWNVVLPIGISFFTFTQIAFLVDTYRGLVEKYQILNYALFVTYFPHLIAGPIIHHKEVMPQFNKNRTFHFNYRNFVLGMTLFSVGLFKKSVLADTLAAYVAPIFDVQGIYISCIDAWIAALSYTLQLYFDFSGYSDMALGLSLLIGIKLPVNFYSPYKSVNIIEFWRRWNMTLSRFLRDYLYISLGGNRKGPIRRYFNLMATMILGGLWHGASWTFAMWGLLHGLYLCINHGWIAVQKMLGVGNKNHYLIKKLAQLLTFLAVIIAWVFFRAETFNRAFAILHAMFFEKIILPSHWHLPGALLAKVNIELSAETSLLSHETLGMLLFSLFIVWFLPNSYQLLRRYKPALLLNHDYEVENERSRRMVSWKPTLVWNYYISLLLVLGIINIQASSIFLYFRF